MADDLAAKITAEKRQFLARQELYAHITGFQDAALQIKGVAISAANAHHCDFETLWEWVMEQIN